MAAAVIYAATGKRKTAVARVRLMPGTGTITVNGKDVKDYFNRQTLTLMVRAPLVETGTEARYDVIASIVGGGKSGQAGALKHGVARALVEADPSLKTDVKRPASVS
jgi:small subunit ribosomal protein S9